MPKNQLSEKMSTEAKCMKLYGGVFRVVIFWRVWQVQKWPGKYLKTWN